MLRRPSFDPARGTVSRHLAIGVVVAVLCLALPSRALAQRAAFLESLLAFEASLAGTYGDEGPQVTASLNRLADSLLAWDRTIQESETRLRGQLAAAAPDVAVRARVALAQMYLERGRRADALRELDAAVAVDPSRPSLHQWRGLLHERSGRTADALRSFRQAWSADRTDPFAAYLLLDRLPPESDDADRAAATAALLEAHARAAGAGRQISTPPFLDLSLIADRFTTVPRFAPALYSAGFLLLEEGRFAEAVAQFRHAAALDPIVIDRASQSAAMKEAFAELRRGRIDAAVQPLEAAVASFSKSAEPRRLLGIVHSLMGQHDRAIAHLDAAVRLSPFDERARISLGRALDDAGASARAEVVLRTTLKALPQSGEARWALADIYERSVRDTDAITELRAALALPVLIGRASLYFRLADIHHRHHEFANAAEMLSARARADPNNAVVYRDLGLAYSRMGRFSHALPSLVLSSLIGPEDAEALVALGLIHAGNGRLADAETVLRRAVALRPDLSEARYALGTTLTRIGKADEGRTHLAEFTRLLAVYREYERRAVPVMELARDAEFRLREGRRDEAADLWRRLAALMPERSADYVFLADALLKSGQLEVAALALERAVELRAGSDVLRRLADLYMTLGRTAAAATARELYQQRRAEEAARN
jgi:tetratricopeptide (TPR) repeat protein